MRKQRLDMKHLAIATSPAICCHWNIAEGKDIIIFVFSFELTLQIHIV
jgi:hypothetical protein